MLRAFRDAPRCYDERGPRGRRARGDFLCDPVTDAHHRGDHEDAQRPCLSRRARARAPSLASQGRRPRDRWRAATAGRDPHDDPARVRGNLRDGRDAQRRGGARSDRPRREATRGESTRRTPRGWSAIRGPDRAARRRGRSAERCGSHVPPRAGARASLPGRTAGGAIAVHRDQPPDWDRAVGRGRSRSRRARRLRQRRSLPRRRRAERIRAARRCAECHSAQRLCLPAAPAQVPTRPIHMCCRCPSREIRRNAEL